GWAARAGWSGRRPETVYLGGGTPSLLSPYAIDAVLDAARRLGLREDAEVTLEANPGTLTLERLAGYRAAGVTRLSLGAQSFQPELLRTLGRDHTANQTRVAVESARAAGFGNVSLDLIFGVPGPFVAAWAADLSAALALAPDHVSAYALTWEEGTPFHAWRARGRLVPVDDDLESTLIDVATERLGAAGFRRYEISSWARAGFESRHNTRYWDGPDYLRLGPGRHAFCATPRPRRWWHLPP